MAAGGARWDDAGWRVVLARSAVGLVGGMVSGLATLSTIGGAIAYSIGNQEDGSSLAWAFHGAYAGLNVLLGWFLLTALAEEERPALRTTTIWAGGTTALLVVYWAWVL
jgi:hypothetical protein